MTEEAPQPPPRNIGLWVGIGCLGILVLSCCLLTYWIQSYAVRIIPGLREDQKVWISRSILVGALEGTRKTCADGAISEDTLPWFHPDMPSNSRNLACALDESMLQALAGGEQGYAAPLSQTGRAELATTKGLDPTLCFLHQTKELRAVGCFDIEGGSGALPYRIVELSLNPQ